MNVVSGAFTRKGQVDWAALCSTGGVSSIVIVWGGAARCASVIEQKEDRANLQTISADGTIGYSRVLAAVPTMGRFAIKDGFEGKGSMIHFCRKGGWVALKGED